MKVKDILVIPVTTCTVNANVGDARSLMKLKNVSALPVVQMDGKKVIIKGILTYYDLAGVFDDNINIRQIMTSDLISVTPETGIKEAGRLMVTHHIHHLIVLDKTNLVGMISSLDFVRLSADA